MLFIIIIIIAHMRVEIGGGRKEPGRLSMYCHNIIFKMSGYKDSLLNSDVNKLEELELGLNIFRRLPDHIGDVETRRQRGTIFGKTRTLANQRGHHLRNQVDRLLHMYRRSVPQLRIRTQMLG